MLAAGCLFLPSQWTQQYKQTIRAKQQPGLHSFFSPNPQPKALDQKPPQPCPSSQSLSLLASACSWHRTGLLFFPVFLHNVCISFSISCKSLLLSVAYQRCLPQSLSHFSSSTTASQYLHLLQRNLLLPRSSIKLKRTQSKVEIWIFLLYEQMERSCLAWPVKKTSIAFPMDNCPSRKGFPSWLSLSPPLSSCALCLRFLKFSTSHQPSLPLWHAPCAVRGVIVTASPALSPLRSTRAVLWLPSALAQHRPIPDTHILHPADALWLRPDTHQGGRMLPRNKRKELILDPHLFFLVPGFLFLSPHCLSLHHRLCVLTCPDLIFQFTLRGRNSAILLVLTDFTFSGIFLNF